MMDNLAYSDCINPRREEMHDGKIVFMGPQPSTPHNSAADNIRYCFRRQLEGKGCVVVSSDTAVYLNDKNYFVPDLMVVCDKSKIKFRGVYGAPDLVVEVLSPGSKRYDRGYKLNLYSRNGVKEYWIVDVNNRSVEVYLIREGGLEIDEIYELYPDYELEGMTDDEKSQIKTEVPVSFLPGITLPLEEIFANPFD
jgi:Uma2 family endonuclease